MIPLKPKGKEGPDLNDAGASAKTILVKTKVSKEGMRAKAASSHESGQYHHGNLRDSLLAASIDILNENGLEALSLRRLAEKVGVSRTAPYHHFKDKSALLAAIAEQGFMSLSQILKTVVSDESLTLEARRKKAVMDYLRFALSHPVQYDLMFGKSLWQADDQNNFQRTAKDCFRQYVHLYEMFQKQGILKHEANPLRLAQLMWAALHGLAKLATEGVFANPQDLEEITAYALEHGIRD